MYSSRVVRNSVQFFTSNYYEDVIHLTNDEENIEWFDGFFPMWGTMWIVPSLDADWIRRNLEVVKDCGIHVYESDELGIFIGINGAGYDFHESHWIPLYEARGLKWHEIDR